MKLLKINNINSSFFQNSLIFKVTEKSVESFFLFVDLVRYKTITVGTEKLYGVV